MVSERLLPTGTVTFLFTDIEGSTKLLDELGEADYEMALADHRTKLREAFGRHAGVEVDTQGDAFFYAFAEAGAALAAAADAQDALAEGPIKVRIGLHTGEARLTAEGYVGRDVHLGARICAAGHGGQVLLSKSTRERVEGEISDLGEHRLKDFAAPVWIYQLVSVRFPPLKTISNTNLPRPASTFVGREKEVAEVSALLRDGVRLVTLTGPGGSGKTRLALESAAELVPEFRNGIFWVDLAPLRDAALVAETIGETVGAKDGLAEHIAERQMLLVLDNLEQVVAAAPELAALLAACPNLRLLDTSRELLRVRGEVEYAVPPLATPDAVELFSERSGLPGDDTIAELCRRLDNLPLAIELAAARTSVLSAAQILERLSKRLDLLKGGRDADPRQATLRATIEWSHDLLNPDEQRLFARLAIFRGGSTLESAEEVADAELDILQSLVDKSLVRHAGSRFEMLETIRQYATERLTESGEADELRRRHADHFLALAEEAEPHVLGLNPVDWLKRLEPEHANLGAAIDWFQTSGETQSAMRIAGASWEYWCLRAHYTEGARRLASLLDADPRPTLPRAKALTGATHLALNAGLPAAQQLLWANEALELYRQLGHAWGIAYAGYQVAGSLTDQGDFATARPMLEASVRQLRAVGDEHRALQAMRALAWCHEELGDQERHNELTEEILHRARAAGDAMMEARALAVLGTIATDEGRLQDALPLLDQAFRIDQQLGDPDEIGTDLIRFARALALAGRPEPAARLLSVREASRPDPESRDPSWLAKMEREALEAARAALDESGFAAAWNEGRRTTPEEAVAQALGRPVSRSEPGE